MTRALSFNVLLESNLSYAHTMRQLFDQTRDKVEWFYGPYGQQMPFVVDRGAWKYVPTQWQGETPLNIGALIEQTKSDFIFMHDDPQRVQWMQQSPIPTLYWLPWDNEDPRVAQLPLIDKVSRTVVVAKFAQDIAERNGFDVGQIYNPIDTEAYHPDPEAGKRFKKRIGIPEDDQLILWVGRPGWRKRLLHTLAIGAKLTEGNPHRHLLLHMDTNDPGMAYDVREALHAFGCLNGDRVIFPGNFRFDVGFPTEVMNEMYNACDVYISANAGEGMNLPAVEAMSCGKPIVMTDVATTREFCHYEERGGDMIGKCGIGAKVAVQYEDKGIIRPSVDIADMVRKVDILLRDESLRNSMGKNGRLFCQKEVDKRVVGARWKQEFDKFNLELMS